MEKFIEFYDNILSTEICDKIEDIILTNSKIPYNYKENLTFEPPFPKHLFKPGISHYFCNHSQPCSVYHSLFNTILYSLCQTKNILIKEINSGRIFVDFPTANPKLDWPPHVDQKHPHWVCLYYVNDSDGDTVFFGDDKEEIKRISPKKGRIAFFDGSIYHAGTPSETNSRAVVNFNFIPYL